MTTLAEQIRAAIDEHERIALAATQGKWKVDNERYAEYIAADDQYGTMVVSGGRWGGEASVFNETEDAIHIAANDPPHALAAVAGHRLILHEHSTIDEHTWPDGRTGYACTTCDYGAEGYRWHDEPYCPTLAALARIYRIDPSAATEN